MQLQYRGHRVWSNSCNWHHYNHNITAPFWIHWCSLLLGTINAFQIETIIIISSLSPTIATTSSSSPYLYKVTKPIQDTVTPSWLWGVFLSIMHITRWHKIAAIRSRWALRTYWHPIGHCTTIEDFISWCCFVYRSEDSRLNPTVRMELHGELCFPWSWPWCPNTKAIAFVAPGLIPLFGPLTCLLRPL